jgi:dephospho-CoA kinase
VVVVPLLFETRGYLDRVPAPRWSTAPRPLQASRTAARSGLAESEVRAIMAAQWPRWRRLQSADDVIWNGDGEAALAAQCERIHRFYSGNAASIGTQSPPTQGGA